MQGVKLVQRGHELKWVAMFGHERHGKDRDD